MEVLEILYEDDNSDTEYNSTQTLTEKSTCELKLSWNYDVTQALIKIVETHYDSLYNPVKRKKMWDKVSADLSSVGYFRTSKQCMDKWKNLIRSYKSCKENNKKTGRPPCRFMFYESMDSFLGSKPDNCAHTIGVGAGTGEAKASGKSTQEVEVLHSSEDSTEVNRKRKVNDYCEVLKKKILLDEKKLDEKMLENGRKHKRHTEKMKFMKRKLDLEERKVLAFEKYIERLN